MRKINPIQFLKNIPIKIKLYRQFKKLQKINKIAHTLPNYNLDEGLKIAVLLLTWKRKEMLEKSLHTLSIQTYSKFDLFISNSNPEISEYIDKTVSKYQNKMKITVIHTSNDRKGFRRFDLGRELVKQGYHAMIFIDDDVHFSAQHVEISLSHYEPKSYKSWWAWRLNGKPYKLPKDRTRVIKKDERVDYCGTGVSIIDISIFSNEGLFNHPPDALFIEDIWLSYYADHILGWKLEYLDLPNIILGGYDEFALYLQIENQPNNKEKFVKDLRKLGWNV